MNKGICYIVGAGDFDEKFIYKRENDIIIAADGGYDHLKRINIIPDLLIGDLDSLADGVVLPENVEVLRYNSDKDDTDIFLAAKHAVSLGFRTIVFFGCLGGRFDHSLANVQMLAWLTREGVKAFLCSQTQIITALKDLALNFSERNKGYISVFAYTAEATGVNLNGFKYCLENASLSALVPVGVSNEFIGKTGKISVENGILILVWQNNIPLNEIDFESNYL